MKRNSIITLIYLVVNVGIGYAQQHDTKEVWIGEGVPAVEIGGFLDDSTIYKLSDFYVGKDLLLIDFWATWCSPCIDAFAKLGDIKQEYGNRIEVIAATYEERKKIERFFQRNPDKLEPDVRFLIGDTLLSELFPHRIIPHVVWIDGEGSVLAITDAGEVTRENIDAVINGDVSSLIMKQDVFDFDVSAHLPVGDDNFLFRSVLTKHRPGVNGIGRQEPFTGIVELEDDDDRPVKRFLQLNAPISHLYMYAAYGTRFLKMNTHMIKLEIQDSLRVVHPLDYEVSNSEQYRSLTHWRRENSYCYELIVPDAIPARLFYQYMMEDLNRYFPVYGTLEKRWEDCYVIVNKDAASKSLGSRGGKMEFIVDSKEMGNTGQVIDRIQNITMSRFVRYLNFENLGIPVVNETVNIAPVDLEIGMPLTRDALDMEKLGLKLSSQGFDVIKTKRFIDILVIRDKED